MRTRSFVGVHLPTPSPVVHSSVPPTAVQGQIWSMDKAMQFYSGNGVPNIPRKKAHGGLDVVYGKYSTMVIEQH